jgi:hypothetical protein
VCTPASTTFPWAELRGPAASARLAVDIGGTFTDLVLEHQGQRTTVKVLTTPGRAALIAGEAVRGPAITTSPTTPGSAPAICMT